MDQGKTLPKQTREVENPKSKLQRLINFFWNVASSLPLNWNDELPDLPMEVWHEIWSYIDFDTLQKKCTVVSKIWGQEIRNSPFLSGEMRLKRSMVHEDYRYERLNCDGINAILSHWLKLKTIHFSGYHDIYQAEDIKSDILKKKINLDEHKLLKRIVVEPSSMYLKELGDGSEIVKKIIIDPKNIQASFQLDNVLCLHLDHGSFQQMEDIGPMMKNLESLSIDNPMLIIDLDWISTLENLKTLEISCAKYDIKFSDSQFESVKKATKLKMLQLSSCKFTGNIDDFLFEIPHTLTLTMKDCNFNINISSLLDTLNVLGEMKNLQMDASVFDLSSDWDEEETKEAFEKAAEVIDQKFSKASILLKSRTYWFVIRKYEETTAKLGYWGVVDESQLSLI